MKQYPFNSQLIIFSIMVLVLASCASTEFVASTAKRVNNAISKSEKVTKSTAIYKIGKPYQIHGLWYYPEENYEYDESGIASWYGKKFHARKTANGEIYDMNALTAAHRTLPMPSFVRVTNLDNGRSLVLRVNDRGPFARGRILDASRRSAQLLGFYNQGTARVRVQILPEKSQEIAAKIKSNSQLARDGTPIIVDKIPKISVNVEPLLPPPGSGGELIKTKSKIKGKLVNQVKSAKTPKKEKVLDQPLPEKVIYGSAKATQLFIQAGAFKAFGNANRTRAILSSLGKVKISQVLVGENDLYRVRLGPIAAVSEADLMLNRVIKSGYPNAQLIVD